MTVATPPQRVVTIKSTSTEMLLALGLQDSIVGTAFAAGHPRDVLTPALLRDVYGVDADVLVHPRTGRPVIAFQEHEDPHGRVHGTRST